MLCADHGPCVSGAHNAIVTSRAGKDLVSSLVSGLLTIGPRFGGAIDDAARWVQRFVKQQQQQSLSVSSGKWNVRLRWAGLRASILWGQV